VSIYGFHWQDTNGDGVIEQGENAVLDFIDPSAASMPLSMLVWNDTTGVLQTNYNGSSAIDGVYAFGVSAQEPATITVTNCSVTAGKETYDTISISSLMNATASDFNDANVIEVTIDSNDMVSPLVKTFPIDSNTFKKGKYKYSKVEGASKTSFAFDTKTSKYSFSAKNVDLSGLACPLTVQIEIGDYIGEAEADETVVNGPKNPIPMQLMMGVKNSLRVDTPKVKHGRTDQLSVKGAFAVVDTTMNLVNRAVVITLGTQTFTIPVGNFRAKKDTFTCQKAVVTEGGTATASFNFKTGAFTLTINNTTIEAGSGTVDFGIEFVGTSYNEVEQITLP
jgi:hypothetical protein